MLENQMKYTLFWIKIEINKWTQIKIENQNSHKAGYQVAKSTSGGY